MNCPHCGKNDWQMSHTWTCVACHTVDQEPVLSVRIHRGNDVIVDALELLKFVKQPILIKGPQHDNGGSKP